MSRSNHRPESSEPSWGKRSDLDVLNRDIPRVDGPVKATGQAVYTHDVRLPNMLWARLLIHPVPRAEIESIGLEAASEMPGVVHIEALKEPGDAVRYMGDDAVLAVVAAETPDQAADALRAIEVKARRLAPVVTPEQALEEGAPVVSRRRNADSNVGRANERGDEALADAALAGAVAVVERSFEIPVQHHVCLETHGHVIQPAPDDEPVTVYASTQSVGGTPRGLARTLGRDASRIRVLTPHMGGGFGSKFGPGLEGALAARIANATGRPVHLMLTRSDEFAIAGNRSGSRQTLKVGAGSDGRLVGLKLQADKLGGVSGGSLPGPPYIYTVEDEAAVSSKIRSVHTATDGSRAMRAPGHPQASFAMEAAMDELAYLLGMDLVEMRIRNLESEVHHRQLRRVAEEIGWGEHPHRDRPGSAENGRAVGIGFGVSVWGPGGRSSRCDVTVRPDGSVVSATATQDLGTGARTYVAAIVAEELGLTVGMVEARIGDSDLPPSVTSGGSVTTGSSAPAIKDAAHKARESLEVLLEDVLEAPVGSYVWKDGQVSVRGDASRSLPWIAVCALLREPLVAQGEFREFLHEGRIHGAQAAKVEVDTLTGRVKVLKMVTCQDQGLPLNRLALRSQINGGMIQALSYGLLEQRVFDEQDGFLLSDNLDLYKIAGAQEIPEMVALIDDEDERPSVCGMAEAPVIPGHSAIAGAIHNACGARLTRMPFTADNVLETLYGKI
jgi:xanthine dehydrogenase YagR molybdenum-binding subunit